MMIHGLMGMQQLTQCCSATYCSGQVHEAAFIPLSAVRDPAVLLLLLLVSGIAAAVAVAAPAELVFNGCFHGLDKRQLLALVSCLTPTDYVLLLLLLLLLPPGA